MNKITLIIISVFIIGCTVNNKISKWHGKTYKQEKQLNTGNNILLREIPNGKLILAAENNSPYATMGELTMIVGNQVYDKWKIPALVGMISLYGIDNKGESLGITNTSSFIPTPIILQIFSPNFLKSSPLCADGVWKELKPKQVFQTYTLAKRMRLELRSSGDFAVILVYEGSLPKVYLLNADEDEDYSIIKNIEINIGKGNSTIIEKLFKGEYLSVVNLSPKVTRNVTVRLTPM